MPRRLLFLVALVAWVATGCQVKLVADVDVARNGSGRISAGVGLDADALKQVGDVATAFRVDDLRQAGWDVQGPRKEGDGLTWVRASKGFADPAQAAATMAELSGTDGPFRDFRLVRTRSLLRSRTTFTGVLDLSHGLSGLSDPDLTARLGDVDLGLGLDGLQQRFGPDLAKSVQVEVVAGLPGKVTTNAPHRDGGRDVWAPPMGQTVQMRATSSAFRIDPRLPAAGAGAIVLLAAAAAVVARRRRRPVRR
ncbi:MAG TPA: hypothetical protein VHT97_14670 [Acidimicrobiales bacterium]|nr:hypothetical protein [Acidimicrobiales bacterium]